MADASYNPALTTALDRVRFTIGDTNMKSPMLLDAEITYALTQQGDTRLCAADLLDVLATRYARRPDTSIDGLSIGNSARAEQMRRAAREIRVAVARGGSIGAPIITGLSLGEMRGVEANTDRPKDRAKLHQDENPGAGGAEAVRAEP